MGYSQPVTATPSRMTRKTAATREAIIGAARELLDEGGPEALTLPAVSERADVAVQTIYNRVGGRDALLMTVAERAMEANRVYLDAAYAKPGSAVQRVLGAAEAYVRFAKERPHEFRLLTQTSSGSPAFERIADLLDEETGRLAGAIADGIAEGDVRPDIDPRTTATVLWAAMSGVIALSWRADRHRADPDALLPLLATAVGEGLLIPNPD